MTPQFSCYRKRTIWRLSIPGGHRGRASGYDLRPPRVGAASLDRMPKGLMGGVFGVKERHDVVSRWGACLLSAPQAICRPIRAIEH